MIINIDRTCGSKGEKVAEFVAEKLGLQLIDDEYIMNKAKELGKYDELLKYFTNPASDVLLSLDLDLEGEEHGEFLNQVLQLMPEDNFVAVGICANHLYRNKGALSIFLTSYLKDQIKTVMEEVDGLEDEDDAKDYIRQLNGRRRLLHEAFTCEPWGDPSKYDICLNVSTCGVEQCAEGIIFAANFKFKGVTIGQ